MKKFVKFNVNGDYLSLLKNSGRFMSEIGNSPYAVILPIDDINVDYIHQINQKVNNSLYFDWEIVYQYTEKELQDASAFRVKILNIFEPSGEECGTKYNEKDACPICGAGRTQKGELRLSNISSMTNYDIGKTIGGEIVVSRRFQEMAIKHSFKGMAFRPILVNGDYSSEYVQLEVPARVEISPKTIFGIDFFDTVNVPYGEEKKINICGHTITLPREVYVCPNGDLVGLRLLSELFINEKSYKNNPYDFIKTSQYVGVKRGLLRPEPLYVCSKKFYEIIKSSRVSGMEFEIVNISIEKKD